MRDPYKICGGFFIDGIQGGTGAANEVSLDHTGHPVVSKIRDCYLAAVKQGLQGQIPLYGGGGIGMTGNAAMDDFAVHNTISHGLYRLRVPSWDNAKFNAPCEFSCPTGIPTQRRMNLLRQGKVQEAIELELEYTPFPGSVCGSVCPNPCMDGCTCGGIDEPIQIGNLGWLSAYQQVAPPEKETGKKIGIIGGGMAGLSAAWQLRRKGHAVTVYDDAEHIGGKLVWPFFTEKITKEGVYANDGRFIPADEVIVSIGEAPVLDYLPEDDSIKKFRGSWLIAKEDKSILPGVFAAGDVIKPGRLTDAIGDGIKAAHYVDEYVMGQAITPFPEKHKIPAERLSKAYFTKCHHCDLGEPAQDFARCISCGTCRDCK